MSAQELLPCPFCGGKASLIRDAGNEAINQRFWVGCTLCSMQMYEYGSNSWSSGAEAKAQDTLAVETVTSRWNRRAPLLAAQPVKFANIGDSEATFIADALRLNCPTCGGSGHIDDVAHPNCGACPGDGLLRPTNFNLIAHLDRQREFSLRTFGPGKRTAGVCDHIRKELAEIEADPNDIAEWVDVILLALDGAWRAGFEPHEIAEALTAKQTKNEGRTWPDWRTADPNKAIEHDRSAETKPATQPAAHPMVVGKCEWPEKLRLRDTGIYDDLGGLGQRIYTTAGAGYEKVEYVRADVAAQPVAQTGVPEGYAVVPLEPTDEMCEAAWESNAADYVGEHKVLTRADLTYKAMLAASPAPTKQAEGSPHDWPEDWSHENGRYECRCVYCGKRFQGHKCRVSCKQCTRDAAPAQSQILTNGEAL